MYVFVFRNLDKLTDNFHSSGGLVVVADNLDRAVQLAQAEDVTFTAEELRDVRPYYALGAYEEEVFLFPNAGCC